MWCIGAHVILSETCLDLNIILLIIRYFTSFSTDTVNMVIKFYDWLGALLVHQLAYIAIDGRHSWYSVIIRISYFWLYIHDLYSYLFTHIMLADISTRDMICSSILNPKFILQVHQFYTCVVKRIHNSIPNITTSFNLRVTRTSWWYCISTRSLPAS